MRLIYEGGADYEFAAEFTTPEIVLLQAAGAENVQVSEERGETVDAGDNHTQKFGIDHSRVLFYWGGIPICADRLQEYADRTALMTLRMIDSLSGPDRVMACQARADLGRAAGELAMKLRTDYAEAPRKGPLISQPRGAEAAISNYDEVMKAREAAPNTGVQSVTIVSWITKQWRSMS